MPRDRSTAPAVATRPAVPPPLAPMIPSTAMVASAVRYPGKYPMVYQGAAAWQRECYRHYAICGEARYAARFFGHALSRAVLRIAEDNPSGRTYVEEGAAVDWLDALFAGKDGQAQMLEALGVHLTVAGECWLVGRSSAYDPDAPNVPFPDGDEHDIWEIVSVIEMNGQGTAWQIKHEGYQPISLTDADVKIRIWIPDPAERTKADSPFRSMLPILREIEALTLHIYTQASSRLAGAGLAFVDQNIDFPPPVDDKGKPIAYANQADGLMLLLARNMEKALQNPGSAAARVPIFATVPTDSMKGDPLKKTEFWSTLDDKARDMRNDSIRRFAVGLDMPPEQLLGMSSNPGTGGGTSNGVSHWGAWQIEEQTIKLHIEPFLELVVNTITVAYLNPLMNGDLGGQKIVYDTSALRLRPDRSKESMELNARGVLKDSVMLRENGFEPSDAMDEKEFRFWLLKKVASGSATPEQVAVAAAEFGVVLPASTGQQPRESRPDPSLIDHPERPRTPQAAALLPAAEAMVYRALERAGNRIRQGHKGVPLPDVEAYEVHTKLASNGSSDKVLEGAWACAPQVLEHIEGIDVEKVTQHLNAYCLNLLTTQTPHTHARLAEFLEV